MKHEAVPQAPTSATSVFGPNLSLAVSYAEILAGDGVERGLIGPRETDRLWDRHILNSAVVAELIDHDEHVVDIGSGAGLPGIPIVLSRPSVRLSLVEPMQRRCAFLTELVAELNLDVAVVRGRAEESAVRDVVTGVDVVTSRAVASLDKLAKWSAPLLRPGGRMLALKGAQAEAEIVEHRRVLASLGMSDVRVVKCGVNYLDPPVTVVMARAGDRVMSARSERKRSSGRNR